MGESSGMRRLRRTLWVHRFVQVVLIALLLYMALLFQEKFQEKYASLRPFYTSLVMTLLIQVAAFFPVRKFAENDARRELAAAAAASTGEEQKQLRSQRLLSDLIKASVFIFFVAFILLLKEQATVFQSTAFFCCLATVLCYLQSFNHALCRGLAAQPKG